jgi:hypothetical protein
VDKLIISVGLIDIADISLKQHFIDNMGTHSSSIVVATQTTVPSWVGTEGEMVPFVSGSVYRLYAYLGGVWRSSSFA